MAQEITRKCDKCGKEYTYKDLAAETQAKEGCGDITTGTPLYKKYCPECRKSA